MQSDPAIVHLTSAHPRYDTRIFLKECMALAQAGLSVSLIVADGKGDEVNQRVNIYDVGAAKTRANRIFTAPGRVFRKARELNAGIYHLHDPELIPIGLKLKKMGKVVIFDAHEDLPKQLLGKPYLGKLSRVLLSKTLAVYEHWACRKFDVIVGATPAIRDKFLSLKIRSLAVNNFPMRDELLREDTCEWAQKQDQVAYVGGISRIRGIVELTQAMSRVKSNVRLQLAGQFGQSELEDEVKTIGGWEKVDALGFLSRREVGDLLARSVAGIVTFLPSPNHIASQPNKMFEYMSAGIPVIASNFPLWRELIEDGECGICVDPQSPDQIADAIDFLINNPEDAARMGRNGRKAIFDKYNWQNEEQKLFGLYRSMIDRIAQ